jgi:hypothetical protein
VRRCGIRLCTFADLPARDGGHLRPQRAAP